MHEEQTTDLADLRRISAASPTARSGRIVQQAADEIERLRAGWDEVAAVEREVRMVAFTSAGDPKLRESMKMCAVWAGCLQKAMNNGR